MDFMKKKSAEEIKSAFHKLVTRPGAEKLMAWLEEETDFFTAPASTKHHLNHPGGLMEHSLNVMGNLNRITRRDLNLEDEHSELPPQIAETVVILGLLHDVCKVNCYHLETKRRKNPETGRWEDYQGVVFRDPLPLGHGEKSLYLIQRHMDLLPEEALAIRWHMGAYDNAAKADQRALSASMAASPWVWRLQEADMCAAWIDERETQG
nr:TraI domain-containing protein [uncultured Dysosmobacter sp.]